MASFTSFVNFLNTPIKLPWVNTTPSVQVPQVADTIDREVIDEEIIDDPILANHRRQMGEALEEYRPELALALLEDTTFREWLKKEAPSLHKFFDTSNHSSPFIRDSDRVFKVGFDYRYNGGMDAGFIDFWKKDESPTRVSLKFYLKELSAPFIDWFNNIKNRDIGKSIESTSLCGILTLYGSLTAIAGYKFPLETMSVLTGLYFALPLLWKSLTTAIEYFPYLKHMFVLNSLMNQDIIGFLQNNPHAAADALTNLSRDPLKRAKDAISIDMQKINKSIIETTALIKETKLDEELPEKVRAHQLSELKETLEKLNMRSKELNQQYSSLAEDLEDLEQNRSALHQVLVDEAEKNKELQTQLDLLTRIEQAQNNANTHLLDSEQTMMHARANEFARTALNQIAAQNTNNAATVQRAEREVKALPLQAALKQNQ